MQSGNAFTGSIPPMAAMTSLSYFNVKSNALSGTIPDDWSTSPFLSAFLIRSNKIRGSIPPPGAVNLYREPGGRQHSSKVAASSSYSMHLLLM